MNMILPSFWRFGLLLNGTAPLSVFSKIIEEHN